MDGRKIFIWGMLFLLLSATSPAADSPGGFFGQIKPNPYQVKAAFVYHILQFVELPKRTDQDANFPLNLFILGEDPFGKTFDPFKGEKVQGRILKIRVIPSGQDCKEAHVLFIASSERPRLAQILKQAQTLGQLTISDTDGFGQQGVMINLYEEKNRIRFEINLEAVKAAGIFMSSHLLKLARIVGRTS